MLYQFPGQSPAAVTGIGHDSSDLDIILLSAALHERHPVGGHIGQYLSVFDKRIRDIIAFVISAGDPAFKIKSERPLGKVIQGMTENRIPHISAYKFHTDLTPSRLSLRSQRTAPDTPRHLRRSR